jgi:hypothetical protein
MNGLKTPFELVASYLMPSLILLTLNSKVIKAAITNSFRLG